MSAIFFEIRQRLFPGNEFYFGNILLFFDAGNQLIGFLRRYAVFQIRGDRKTLRQLAGKAVQIEQREVHERNHQQARCDRKNGQQIDPFFAPDALESYMHGIGYPHHPTSSPMMFPASSRITRRPDRRNMS
jgi:hypothetical protein